MNTMSPLLPSTRHIEGVKLCLVTRNEQCHGKYEYSYERCEVSFCPTHTSVQPAAVPGDGREAADGGIRRHATAVRQQLGVGHQRRPCQDQLQAHHEASFVHNPSSIVHDDIVTPFFVPLFDWSQPHMVSQSMSLNAGI